MSPPHLLTILRNNLNIIHSIHSNNIFSIYYYTHRCKLTSWITMNNNGASSSSVIHNYLLSLYWSTTTTTLVGYGDIVPVTNSERILAICVMLLGIWCYGYMLGSAAAIITHTLQPRYLYYLMMDAYTVHVHVCTLMSCFGYIFRQPYTCKCSSFFFSKDCIMLCTSRRFELIFNLKCCVNVCLFIYLFILFVCLFV